MKNKTSEAYSIFFMQAHYLITFKEQIKHTLIINFS